jgi:hypothetical protein
MDKPGTPYETTGESGIIQRETGESREMLFSRPGLSFRKRPDRSISCGRLFGLGIALAQYLVHDDRTEGCYTDPADGETANSQTEVDIAHANHAGADGQSDSRSYQVAAPGEVDFVLNPDAPACYGDQAKKHDSKATQNSTGNGRDQRTKLRAEAQQDGNQGGNNKVEARVDARDGHHTDIFDNPLLMMSVTRRDREKEIMFCLVNGGIQHR